MQQTDPKAYQLWTLTIDDMISDGVPIQYICDMQRFQIYMEEGKIIARVSVKDIDLDLDGNTIIANMSLDVTVDNRVHHVFVSVIDSRLINAFVTHAQTLLSQQLVNNYFHGK